MNEEPKEPARVGQGMDYGEQADVQQVHAAVQREKREPRVGAEPLSIWLIAIYGLAIFLVARISAVTRATSAVAGSTRWARRLRQRKQWRVLLAASRRRNYRPTIAARRFSRRIVRPVIKPMVKACRVNIRLLPVPNLQLAARDAWA